MNIYFITNEKLSVISVVKKKKILNVNYSVKREFDLS